MKNGILVGVKKEWFLKKADFLCDYKVVDDDFFRIHKNRENALNFKIENQKTRLCNPFYINSKGFYKVIYDDELVKNIRGNTYIETDSGKINGYSFTPEVAGIIKSTHGLCKRDGQKEYVKDWTSENEVRLKVGIQQLSNSKNGYEIHDGMVMDEAYFPMIRIILSDKAFEIIRIRFSLDFVNKNEFIEKIKNVLPNSKIELLE